MNKAFSLFALFALPLVGCKPSGASLPGTTAVGDAPKGMPDALKNDAFEFYGLGNDKPVRMEIAQDAGGMPGMGTSVGTRTIKLQKIEGGKATYVLSQEGALGNNGQGEITLSLEKDGLYTMASSTSKLKPHSLEMPARLEVGGGWKDHTEMSDGRIVLDNEIKIVGFERVSTPGGTFDDALHVTSTGGGTMGEGPIDLTTESWYVRGKGAVKQILNITPKGKGGQKRTITMQLAGPEKAAEPAPDDTLKIPASPPPSDPKALR